MRKKAHMVNHNSKIASYSFTFITMIMAIVAICYRLSVSVDLSDEAYGIAEIYNASFGKKPFIDIWDPHPGWFLFVPLLRAFRFFSADLEGVVLYFRIVYFLSVIIILTCVFYITKNRQSRETQAFSALSIFMCACYIPYSIPQMTYNSGVTYLLIAVTTIICGAKEDLWFVFSGIIIGVSCLLYPTISLSCILVFLILLFDKGKKKSLAFAIGIGLVAMIFLGWLLAGNSFQTVIEGVVATITSPHQESKGAIDTTFLKTTFIDRLIVYFSTNRAMLWVLYICTMIISRLKISPKKKQTTVIFDIVASTLFILITMIVTILDKNVSRMSLGGYCCIAILGAYMVLCIRHKLFLRQRSILYGSILLGAWLLTYCFTSDNKNIFMALDAAGPLLIFEYGIVLETLLTNDLYSKVIIKYIAIVVIMITGLSCFYSYVYRDAPIYELKYKVERGIYKGLHTTYEKKEYVESLEVALKEKVNKDASICMVNNMPAIYLMCRNRITAPQTWDSQYLSKGFISAEPLLSYFDYIDEYPDIFIANDYLYPEIFNSKDPEIWAYIDQNYSLVDRLKSGNFTTVIWERNEGSEK